MNGLAFPAELVEEIIALWAELEATGVHVPPLPPRAALRSLVEVAFWTSLSTEEGRALRFSLCCTPIDAPVRRGALGEVMDTWGLWGDRPLDVPELRRLAVATATNAAIWVQFGQDDQEPRIHGLLNLGLSWQIARLGLSDQLEPMPDAFFLYVDGPGTVTVLLNQVPVLGLYQGSLRRPRSVIRPFGGSAFFQDGIQAMARRLREPCAAAPEASKRLLERTYFHVLRTILSGIRDRGHGGALVMAPGGSIALDAARAIVRPRYVLADGGHLLAASVLGSVEAQLTYEECLPADGEQSKRAGDEALALRAASMRLVEGATFVAGLAGTDGAIVMQTDMTLVGFGAEIAVEPRIPVPVLEVPPHGQEGAREVSAVRYGMRHRSALWLCATAPDTSAFIVSQDGGVSFIFGQGGQVFLMPDLETLHFAAESTFE